MAKSKCFFGLRTGSTRSLTFRTDPRGPRDSVRIQITMDRTDVAEKYKGDIIARGTGHANLTAALVSSALSKLHNVVSYHYDGINPGEKSRSYFRSANQKKYALDIRQYCPKGTQDCGVANYLIANGTAQQWRFQRVDDTTAEIWDHTNIHGWTTIERTVGHRLTKDEVINYGVDNLLADMLKKDNGYLVLVSEYRTTPYNYTYDGGPDYGVKLYKHDFHVIYISHGYALWSLKEFTINEDDSFIFVFSGHGGKVLLTLNGTLRNGAIHDGNLIKPSWGFLTRRIVFNQRQTADGENQAISAIACINCELINNQYISSPSRLTPIANETLSYDAALESYKKNTTASTRYLNNGGNDTGLS